MKYRKEKEEEREMGFLDVIEAMAGIVVAIVIAAILSLVHWLTGNVFDANTVWTGSGISIACGYFAWVFFRR